MSQESQDEYDKMSVQDQCESENESEEIIPIPNQGKFILR